jgi:hypothetical protein
MPKKLTEHPIHLGLGASAVPQPPFAGMEWYADYSSRTSSDGAEGRLSMYTFDASWDSWEMHPHGAGGSPGGPGSALQASSFSTTRPETSVSRNSRPWKR